MPTTRPRYQVTDTGEVRAMLDAAQERWPQVADRKRLLLELARRGADAVRDEAAEEDDEARRARQRDALAQVRRRVDLDVLLGDDAWR